MTADVFKEPTSSDNTPAVQAHQPSGDPAAQTPGGSSVLDALVGEGKKYKTAEDLAAAYGHADQHIATLTSELSEIRKDLDGRLNVVEMLKELLT